MNWYSFVIRFFDEFPDIAICRVDHTVMDNIHYRLMEKNENVYFRECKKTKTVCGYIQTEGFQNLDDLKTDVLAPMFFGYYIS